MHSYRKGSQSVTRGVTQPPSHLGPLISILAHPPETLEHCHTGFKSSISTQSPGAQSTSPKVFLTATPRGHFAQNDCPMLSLKHLGCRAVAGVANSRKAIAANETIMTRMELFSFR